MMLFETIRLIFILCGLGLCVALVIAANRMSGETCNCQKACLILILIGASMQLVFGLSSVMAIWGMLASIPISLGLALKLAIDRRQQHCAGHA